MIVLDLMNENENQKVKVVRAESRRETNPCVEVLYIGELKKIPPDIQALEVLQTGRSMAEGCVSITVFRQN